MVEELLEYRVKRHLAAIDRLITELVVIRQYINSVKVGLTYCRQHVTRGSASVTVSRSVERELLKNQEILLFGLRKAEKRVKRQLLEASRELASVCSYQRAAK
ncbi:MAG: hypothetical protein ACYC4H_06665 [Desulfocucumaceae bacterium]